ncbi:unnamed protein product [Amaranthus hypochondriacus]
MASAVGPSPPPSDHHLSMESIPTVDLRLLSQSELTALSLCSSHSFDLRRCDDVVIPKIDRSIFNESAGSRKQTYSRLRLARNSSTTSENNFVQKPRNSSLSPGDSDNSRIVSLFKSLFNGGNLNEAEIEVENAVKYDDSVSALVPVNVEYSDSFLSGNGDGNGGDVVVIEGERKRKRGRKPKNAMVTTVALYVEKKNEVDEEEVGEREKELVNKNGEVVNLGELGKKEDPYREEIRKQTEGKETPEELLGFITDLEGQWGSRRKKRKIVDANLLGDALPNGWKVLIAMKKKQGRAWVFCRRYISPKGRYFVSCKEVSSYLLSLTSPEDLAQQTAVECPGDVAVVNKLVSENATGTVTKIELPSLSVSPQISDLENQLNPLSTPQMLDHEKQLVLVTNVQSGEVQLASALKCHKCSTGFNEKDELLSHLLSCHKRKRRKSGAPIEEDLLMKDGKYECQFCNKLFHERSSYFGHVGIHVKNYVKSIGGSPGMTLTTKKKTSAIPIAEEVPVTVSETVQDVEMNVLSVSSAPNILVGSEHHLHFADRKGAIGCEAETHLGNDSTGQVYSYLHTELNKKTDKSNNISPDESSDKYGGTGQISENYVREVKGSVDLSDTNTDNYSVPGDKNVNDELGENIVKINATHSVGLEISNPSDVQLEIDETYSHIDGKQVDLENDGNFSSVNHLQRGKKAFGNEMFAQNKETSSDRQNCEDRSFGNNIVEHSSFADGLELGNDDRLMDGSEIGHLDVGIDDANDVQHCSSLAMDGSKSGHVDLSIDAADDVQHPGGLDMVGSESGLRDLGIDATNDIQHPGSLDESSDVLHTGEEILSPSGDQTTTLMQKYEVKDLFGMISETEVDMCSLEDAEATVDAEGSIVQERPENFTAVLSRDNGCGYIANEAETVMHMKMVESRETGGFEIDQTCSLENSSRELFNRKCEEPKSDRLMNSDLFFPPVSNDRHLAANVITSNDRPHRDASNFLVAFNNFVEDKQEEVNKSILSGLSMNEHMRDVSMSNALDVPSTTATTQLPELDKMDSSRTNKLNIDFGSITELNARFMSSVQNEPESAETSPFSLWGQQTCTIEDNQTRGYGGGGARGVAQHERDNARNLVGLQQPSNAGYNLNKVCLNEQRYGVQHNETRVYRKHNEIRREGIYDGARGLIQQERASDNNSLNLVGLQQPSNAGFNLNKVHINEQRYYGVQHNESGVYSKSSEPRSEGVSHGNTLDLVGLQQQCDAGYNLNKPCINQQSFCLQTGGYNASDESKQERVTYGNSLSLASVPCEPRYGLNKACIPQTCDAGFSMNKGYMGTMQGLSKIDELGHSRDQDLMIGFGNSSGEPNQGVPTDFMWRSTEGNILPGGLMRSSSSQGQSSGSYQAFDFLSDKGGNDLYAANEKFDNISSLEGLRSTGVEPMEFSFMTTQDTNAQMGHQKVMFNTQLDQGFGSSVWHQKPTLPNMMAGHVVSTVCVWCGNEFHQDSLGCEMQAGSIGFICPTCKARMSAQYL